MNELPAKMKAVRLLTPGEPLRVEEVPVPEIGARDVLVRVEASGFNGGDTHLAIQGSIPLHVSPITIGHEAAGTIIAVGAEVSRAAVGDRVHLLQRLRELPHVQEARLPEHRRSRHDLLRLHRGRPRSLREVRSRFVRGLHPAA
jgi:NADPH:quinone reductase-like Zn-dependent oxidoreductase